jgi:hypothetical protein
VGHFSQHSESLCAFASKGCLMIIIIFCRHDSILTQGWRDKQQRATDGRAEVDPVSWTPICLSFGVHNPSLPHTWAARALFPQCRAARLVYRVDEVALSGNRLEGVAGRQTRWPQSAIPRCSGMAVMACNV